MKQNIPLSSYRLRVTAVALGAISVVMGVTASASGDVTRNMPEYTADNTALLIVDPYHDFMSEGGKYYDMTAATREHYDTFDNMKSVIAKAREAGMTVIIVPHHRYTPETISKWNSPTHSQIKANDKQLFAKGSWGGTFHPLFGPQQGDLVVSEHFYQSGFANTDLAMQLNQRGLSNIILVGMIANTCIETTGKYGAEQGFNVTLVSDAMAAYSLEAQHNAITINGPTYAHAIYSTAQLLTKMPEAR